MTRSQDKVFGGLSVPLSSKRVCRRCAVRPIRVVRAWYCVDCRPIASKLYADAWRGRNRDRALAASRRYNAKLHRGVVVTCATLLCVNTFVRGPRQGARKFCDCCARAHFVPAVWRIRLPDRPVAA